MRSFQIIIIHLIFLWGAQVSVSLVVVVEALQLLPIPLRHKLQKKLSREVIGWDNNDGQHQPTIISVDVNLLGSEDAQTKVDEYLMGMALQQARDAGEKFGEVPIGAIITEEENPILAEEREDEKYPDVAADGNADADAVPPPTETVRRIRILSSGQNQIETNHDASAHAEMQALRAAAEVTQNWRLLNATLYTTLEPCPMCLSAAQAFRISRIVYGAPDLRLGATGTYVNLLEAKHPFHDTMEVVGGIRGEEAKTLLVEFFRARRKKGKKKKHKRTDDHDDDDVDQANAVEENNTVLDRGRFRRILHKFAK